MKPRMSYDYTLQKNVRGKAYITVSAKGISNGLSDIPNDGADFGPDTPGTQTNGIMEAINALPKIKNANSGRLVPIGTVFIHFGGVPIQIQSPINVYDDWFINIISDDGFTSPIQLPATPYVYIQNVNSANIFNIITNPVAINSTNWQSNGFIQLHNLVFYTNYSTTPGTIFNSINNSNNVQPMYSQLLIGNLGLRDTTGQNLLMNIITTGGDDLIKIDNLVAIGTTNNNGPLVTFGANHVDINYIALFSGPGPSTTTNGNAGFMAYFSVGGNFTINTMHLIGFGANGAFATIPIDGNSYTRVLNIREIYDEMGSTKGNASYGYGGNYCSVASRAITIINSYNTIPAAPGTAFIKVLYPETLKILSTPQNVGPFYTTIAGTTAGNVYCNSNEFSPHYKKYVIKFVGYENNTTTNQTLNFAFPFSTTASITANTTGLTVSTTTTGITITAPNNTTVYNGIVVVEGY
jgi:hypothetical protein